MPSVKTSSHVRLPNWTASESPVRPSDLDTITDFREHLQAAGKSPKTVVTYREAALAFVAFTARKGMPVLEQVTREHLEDYFGELRLRGNRPSTVRNRQASLRAIFAWMLREDIRTGEHPMARIRLEKIPEQVLPHYADDDVLALLAAIPNKATDLLALRDRALILLLCDTGLRGQELCDVRLGHAEREARQVEVVKGKGGKGRMVAYSTETANAIARYLRRRGGWEALGRTAPLFAQRNGQPLTLNSVRSLMQRRFGAAGVEFRGVHGFRRTFGIAFLEAGGDPIDLKELAGWSSWSMLHRYTRATARSRALRAHEEHSPVARLMQKKGKGR